jgi:hypothetical protein
MIGTFKKEWAKVGEDGEFVTSNRGFFIRILLF